MTATKCALVLIVMLGIAYQAAAAAEESYGNLLRLNLPYGGGRGMSNELQLARLLLLPPYLCHSKRNSELINSLLGLPKNMNNAGK